MYPASEIQNPFKNTFYYHYVYFIVITLWEFFWREVRNSTNLAWLPGQLRDMLKDDNY